MISDIEMIRSFYRELPGKMEQVRSLTSRPLTITEKILFAHLTDFSEIKTCRRGLGYNEYAPDRVAMQDATAQMVLLQLMVTGIDHVALPSSVHCDHLITAANGSDDDLRSALEDNKEVYDFLSSACLKYGIDFWDPGSGIIHQVILENYAFPGGMIIGTDSHTPNAGGLGMIAVGTGGADAVDAMTGSGWELKLPRLIGVKLTGRLNGWASPKDVILKLTGLLTVKGGTGSVIEYFGEGAELLTATGKATICNMGAETGATCSIFGFDESMADYLMATGRKEIAERALDNRQHLMSDPEVRLEPLKYYDRFIEIDLSELEPYINGPFTPDRATPLSAMKEETINNSWPPDLEAGLIGSCTNSSFEDLSRAASVVSDALSKKLVMRSRFLITPGSRQVRKIAEKEGFLDTFKDAGGIIFANACGPCIGQWRREGAEKKKANSIIHSFNRNFSGRADGNPNTHAFVASPEIVTALAFAGRLTFNPITDYLVNSEGEKVRLSEPAAGVKIPGAFPDHGRKVRTGSFDDRKDEVVVNPGSDRLQLLDPFPEWHGNDFMDLYLLIKVKGKCTTDHISAAGIWLRYRGHLENISDNYMIGATNSFNGQTNSVLNQLMGEYDSVPETAKAYRDSGLGSIVVGEDNFGEGSSREHAAMEARYLGVKALLVKSFARIHESNLKKQGVLTLTFAEAVDYERIKEDDRIDIIGLSGFAPGKHLTVRLKHSDGRIEEFRVLHSYNENQIKWFRAGSALNTIRNSK